MCAVSTAGSCSKPVVALQMENSCGQKKSWVSSETPGMMAYCYSVEESQSQ